MSLYGISFCYCWIPKKGHELLKHSSLLHCLVFWYIFLIKIFFIPRLRLEKGLCGYEPLSNFWSLFIETQRKICETWWLKLCSWKSKFRKLLWESDDHHCEPCGKWQERWPGNAYICICLWKHIVLPLSPGFLLSCHQYEPCHMQCSPAVGAPRQCLCPAAAAPPAVTLGLPHAPGTQFACCPLCMGNLEAVPGMWNGHMFLRGRLLQISCWGNCWNSSFKYLQILILLSQLPRSRPQILDRKRRAESLNLISLTQ